MKNKIIKNSHPPYQIGSKMLDESNLGDKKYIVYNANTDSYELGEGIDKISANDVIESTSRQFVTPSQKAQIDSNTAEIDSLNQRLYNLENKEFQSDHKVKMGVDDIEGYLSEKVDNDTIKIFNNKLYVEKLYGMIATIEEINALQGIEGNIQQQLNALTSIGNFSTSVENYSDLLNIEEPKNSDMVIVINDETRENKSTIYVFNGIEWQFSGEFKGGEIRDFTTNPINLETETTGLLPSSKIENVKAKQVTIDDLAGYFNSDNVEDALVELFQFANSGKESVAQAIGYPLSKGDTFSEMVAKIEQLKVLIASAIMEKGVAAYPYNTLQEMANKIKTIPNVSLDAGIKRKSKINIVAPYTYEIELDEPLRIEDIAVTVLEYVGDDSNVVHYQSEYNNSESTSFNYNERYVVFDGRMRLNDKYSYNVNVISNDDHDFYESEEIDLNEFVDFSGSVNINTSSVNITALPHPQVVVANGDILLTGVDSIDKIEWENNESGNGKALIAMSFDSGDTFYAYKNGTWIQVNIYNDFEVVGNNLEEINKLTDEEFKLLRNESDTLRFAYYLNQPTFNDKAENNRIRLYVTMQGYNVVADTSKYNYDYDVENKKLVFNFTQNGTYTFTYVDGK